MRFKDLLVGKCPVGVEGSMLDLETWNSCSIPTGQWRIQDFPKGGAWTLQGGAWTRNFAKFSQKLHEIERIWMQRGGRASLTPPLRSATAGGNILLLEFCFHIVKPLIPILALLSMLCVCENHHCRPRCGLVENWTLAKSYHIPTACN